MGSTVGMVSRVDVYDLCDQRGFFFLEWVPCLHAGCEGTSIERWNSSSDEANRGPETEERNREAEGDSRAFGRMGASGSPTEQCSKKRLAPVDYRNRSCFDLILDHRQYSFPYPVGAG